MVFSSAGVRRGESGSCPKALRFPISGIPCSTGSNADWLQLPAGRTPLHYACSAPAQYDAEGGICRREKTWPLDGNAQLRNGDPSECVIRTSENRINYLEKIVPESSDQKPDQAPPQGDPRQAWRYDRSEPLPRDRCEEQGVESKFQRTGGRFSAAGSSIGSFQERGARDEF